jgi:hypothetical protein
MSSLRVQEESPFSGIAACAWFCAVAVVTVGYGDLVPVSSLGRCITVMAMLLGIIVIALPITVVGSTFRSSYEEMKDEHQKRMSGAVKDIDLLISSVSPDDKRLHAQHHCLGISRPARIRDRIVIDGVAATKSSVKPLMLQLATCEKDPGSGMGLPGSSQGESIPNHSPMDSPQQLGLTNLGASARIALLQVRDCEHMLLAHERDSRIRVLLCTERALQWL